MMRNWIDVVVTILTILVLGVFAIGMMKVKKPRRVTVIATAYCPCAICCGENADGRTSTGTNAWRAGVAVDPEFISLGSHIDVPEHLYSRGPNENGSWIRADDTGSEITGNRIDLRFVYHWQAEEFGKRKIRVRIHDK